MRSVIMGPDPSKGSGPRLSRRRVIQGILIGGGTATLGILVAACGGQAPASPTTAPAPTAAAAAPTAAPTSAPAAAPTAAPTTAPTAAATVAANPTVQPTTAAAASPQATAAP